MVGSDFPVGVRALYFLLVPREWELRLTVWNTNGWCESVYLKVVLCLS